MKSPKNRINIFFILMLLLPFSACSSHEEPEEEHAHFPSHWPYTLEVARERLQHLREGQEGTPDVPLSTELLDLVKWLPELVADTELDESTFNKIDAWSEQLQKEWGVLQSGQEECKKAMNHPVFSELMDFLNHLVIPPAGVPPDMMFPPEVSPPNATPSNATQLGFSLEKFCLEFV